MTQGNTDLIDKILSLDGPAALARKREVEAQLAIIKGDILCGDLSRSAEREELKRENEALGARLGEFREAQKATNLRRNMAGIGSAFYDAVVERFPAEVPTLEAAAFAKLDERQRKNAERKANKADKGEKR